MEPDNKRISGKLFAKIKLVNEVGAISEHLRKGGRLKIETTVIGKMESVIKLSKVE